MEGSKPGGAWWMRDEGANGARGVSRRSLFCLRRRPDRDRFGWARLHPEGVFSASQGRFVSEPSLSEEESAMSSEKSEVKFESTMGAEEAIAYFEQIIASLKRGSVTINQGGKTLTLNPTQTMKVEVEAERKKDKEEIKVEMKWKTKVPELTISGNTQ
jgi:amphi-Trp domain-containing protein